MYAHVDVLDSELVKVHTAVLCWAQEKQKV